MAEKSRKIGTKDEVLPYLNGVQKCHKCVERLREEHNMVKFDNVTEGVLDVINDNKFSQTGAFNLRENGTSICHEIASISR